MKTFINQAAQGDCFIKRIEGLPEGVKAMQPVDGHFIVAHSETGHHHVLEAKPGIEVFEDMSDPETLYLSIVETEAVLEHLRSFDTHEPIGISPGIYCVRRQREYTPEGWRRVAD